MTSESTDKKMDSIVVNIATLVKNSDETYKELKTQTGLLTEIRDFLKDIKEAGGKGGSKKGGVDLNLKGGIALGGFLVASSAALAASSYFLQMVTPVSTQQLQTAILLSIALVPITIAFIKVYETMRPIQSLGERAGHFVLDKIGASKRSPISQKSALGMSFAIIIGSILSIAAASYILQQIAIPSLGQIATAFLIGFSLQPMVVTFGGMVIAMKKAGIRANKKGLKDLGMTGLALVIMVGALAGVAYALRLLPPQLVEPPEFMWVLQTGFMLWVFSHSFAKVLKVTKGMKVKDILKATLVYPLMALAIVSIAKIFSFFGGKYDNSPPVAWSLQTGLALYVFAFGFMKIMERIRRYKYKTLAKGAVALGFLAAAIVATAFIFSQYGGGFTGAPPVAWSLQTGLALAVFGVGFAMIVKSMKGVSAKQLLFGVLGTAAVGLAILGANYLFQYLVDEWNAPPLDWTLKAGVAIAAFGVGFYLIAKTVGKLGVKDMLFGLIGMVVIAVGILAVSWIFSILPDKFLTPPMDFTLSAVVALIGFGVVVGIIGAIIMATGGTGLAAIALGVVGMIIIAAGILAVAWILSYIPAGKLAQVAAGLTDALLAPVNGIVDVLARLKNEIGVENLIPLAGGILAISGSLIALAAATAGVAAAGLGSALANAGTAFVNWLSGEEKQGPMEILEKLVGMAGKIQALATAMTPLGNAFASITRLATLGNIERINSLVKATVLGNAEMIMATGMDTQTYFRKFPRFLNDVADAYANIVESQNGIDGQVIEKTTNLVKALAYLNEVGGDNAMAKLGDALVNAVKELSNMISQFSGSVDAQTEAGKESASALSKATNSLNKAKASGTVSADGKTVEIDIEPVVDAIEELQRIVRRNNAFG